MKLLEVKYDHGKTIERVLKYFVFHKMTYGPRGEKQPVYVIREDFIAQLEGGEYVNDIVLGESSEGKFAYINNRYVGGRSKYLLDWFLENIEIFKKDKVL